MTTSKDEPTLELVRFCEQLIYRTMGHYTSLTDPRNKGLLTDLAERYSKELEQVIEATSQRARIEELESLTGCPPILVEATINDRIAALSKKGQK